MAFISALEVYFLVGQGRNMGCIPFCSSMESHMHILVTNHSKNSFCTSCHVLLGQAQEQNSLWQAKQLLTSGNYLELFLKYELEDQLGDIS